MPTWPVIQVGPVLVMFGVPERTAKLPAVPSPGAVGANAAAGQAAATTAVIMTSNRSGRLFFISSNRGSNRGTKSVTGARALPGAGRIQETAGLVPLGAVEMRIRTTAPHPISAKTAMATRAAGSNTLLADPEFAKMPRKGPTSGSVTP